MPTMEWPHAWSVPSPGTTSGVCDGDRFPGPTWPSGLHLLSSGGSSHWWPLGKEGTGFFRHAPAQLLSRQSTRDRASRSWYGGDTTPHQAEGEAWRTHQDGDHRHKLKDVPCTRTDSVATRAESLRLVKDAGGDSQIEHRVDVSSFSPQPPPSHLGNAEAPLQQTAGPATIPGMWMPTVEARGMEQPDGERAVCAGRLRGTPHTGPHRRRTDYFTARRQSPAKPRRRQRNTRSKQLTLFYLNMNGGRLERKWEELFEILGKENVVVAGFVETHLRNAETPPPHRGYVWEGLNRHGSERKGGGMGCLIKLGSQWERRCPDCSEHMWLTGCIGQLHVAFGLVYLWTGRESSQHHTQTLECMEKDLQTLGLPAIIVGDFNAHI